METARIVAMAMILIGHFILYSSLWNGSDFISHQDVSEPVPAIIFILFYSICVVGVNIFVLISGYFTIHLTWKSFLSYYLLCIFYNGASFLIDVFLLDGFSTKALLKVFLVDKTVNWFFRAYFWLMLLSPLLNKALEHLSLKELRIIVALLFFLNCISGFIFQEFNTNGYNVYNFIFLYVLGNWISKDFRSKLFSGGKSLAVYLLFCLLNALVAVLILFKSEYSLRHVFAYNNPLIILASVGLLVFFTRLHFSNKFINVFASTVVAALFIQQVYFKLQPVIHVTNTLLTSVLLITPLLFILAFAIEFPRKQVATFIISRVLSMFQNQSFLKSSK
ncbi:MAG: acyltransferase family protein [Bacteroidales bacterium]|nr:acyltransferase family protein [Bacteroidales bacterium]